MNMNMFPFTEIPLQPSFKKPPFQPYDQIQNPIISKHDDSSPPFFPNFPSPFFDEHELLPLNQIFPNFHSKPANPSLPSDNKNNHTTTQKSKKDPPRRRTGLVAAAPRKRTGKKDRHSKICTAQGIRDRRMRLSLQVARKFFDLQDMLGYDKASKTIEWLFNKSKRAIKDLAKDVTTLRGNNNTINVSISTDGKSESFISECEVVSGINENTHELKKDTAAEEEQEEDEDDGSGSFEKKWSRRTVCKPNTRESREKARARARCRTEEKMMGKRVEDPVDWTKPKTSPNRNDLQKLGSFDGGDDPERVSAYGGAAAPDYSPLLHPSTTPLSDVGTIEKLLGSSTSDYHTTNFMGFLGNWDLLTNDRINYALTNIQASNSMAGNPNSIIYSATAPDFPLFHQ